MRKVIVRKKLEDPLRWSPDSEYLLYTEPDAANILYKLAYLTDRLTIHRVKDGAEFAVFSGLPKNDGWFYDWIVAKPPAH